jgi:uncharacterized membrane protein YidH (DUF202 family)
MAEKKSRYSGVNVVPAANYRLQRMVQAANGATMKPLTILGVVLIVLGVLALAYQRITYTTRETVIDVGPIEATAERQKTIPLPPILGAAAVAAGVIVLVVGNRRRP